MHGGIVRDMDPLGRVVLPIELRGRLGIKNGDSLEIFVDKDCIIFKKYAPGCVFCGEVEGTTSFRGKPVCEECLERLQAFADTTVGLAGKCCEDEPCEDESCCGDEPCEDEPCCKDAESSGKDSSK